MRLRLRQDDGDIILDVGLVLLILFLLFGISLIIAFS